MDKRVIKKVIIALIIIGTSSYIVYKDNQKFRYENNEAERLEAIKDGDRKNDDLEKPGGIDEPYESYATSDITLLNRTEFLDSVENIDTALMVANIIPNKMKYLNVIIADCKADSIEEYFTSNEEVIDILYGITTVEGFTEFYNTISVVSTIKDMNILIESVVDNGNTIGFELNLNGDKGSCILKLTTFTSKEDTNIFIEKREG